MYLICKSQIAFQSNPLQEAAWKLTSPLRLVLAVLLSFCCCCSAAFAQGVPFENKAVVTATGGVGKEAPVLKLSTEQPWEFAPYRSQIWLSIDPAIPVSESVRNEMLVDIESEFDMVYGPVFEVDATKTPRSLFSRILREIETFSIEQVLSSELVMVITRSPAGKEFRTLESILNKADSISLTDSSNAELRREMNEFMEDEQWKKLAGLLKPTAGTVESLVREIKIGSAVASLIRRSEFNDVGRGGRIVPLRFPWQMDSLLRSRDKVFAVSVIQQQEQYQIQLREIDCLMRVVGPLITRTVSTWEQIPRAIAFDSQKAFAPIVRVEEADNKLASLRIRAGGLITDNEHPARLVSGDVLQPYVRRDDRNGVPTLLQRLPWTYIGLIDSDNVNAQSAIYSGIRGALAGRKNKRTTKIGLKVRPVFDETVLRLGVNSKPELTVAGSEIYRRTPGSDDLAFVGRSDWRGMVSIEELSLPEAFYDLPKPPEPAAISDATKTDAPPADATAAPDATASATAPVQAAAPEKPAEKPPKGKIKLNAPLYLYYVKNGNTLLAKLPIVTGQTDIEVAGLPDDRRRLEAEAFIKGIQGEMLDLVARRQILASRIRTRIETKNKVEAQELLVELEQTKSYDKMSEDLDALQRRILSSERGQIPLAGQTRIDKMFDATRQMLQKYLQDSLLRDLQLSMSKL